MRAILQKVRMKKVNIAVLGDGGWGTALSIVLSDHGAEVTLWSHDEEYAKEVASTRTNPLSVNLMFEKWQWICFGFTVSTLSRTFP